MRRCMRNLAFVLGAGLLAACGGGTNGAPAAGPNRSSAEVMPPRVPRRSPTAADLRAVWGSGLSDVPAVGSGGTILDFDGRAWGPFSERHERESRGDRGRRAPNEIERRTDVSCSICKRLVSGDSGDVSVCVVVEGVTAVLCRASSWQQAQPRARAPAGFRAARRTRARASPRLLAPRRHT